MTTFPKFFKTATGHPPYAWQGRLANGEHDRAEDQKTHHGSPCVSRLINIPTGLGKTAGVVLAWLWNRRQSDISNPTSEMHGATASWPRRLVYCLPMRTLVEQTEREVRRWIEKLVTKEFIPATHERGKPRVIVLMGGESLEGDEREWDLYPEQNAILIGTQDMLLSRALNRGYGMSRYRWPMHFALLNNDCLWVMDEVQLMGAGLACSTQLEGFRAAAAGLGSRNVHSWWMSATIRPDWLATVDFPASIGNSTPLSLNPWEKQDGARVEALRTAPKQLIRATSAADQADAKALASYIVDHHVPDHLNLVVVNTVKRARLLHAELAKQLGKARPPAILLHSQFRPDDRQRILEAIRQAAPGQIVVSTQVIEAGVDLSAHSLFTELAPWSSLVQRFGRCNRWLVNDRPQFPDARIHWFNLDETKQAAPYLPDQLTAARALLEQTDNASLAALEIQPSPDTDRPIFRHVLRRKDLIELFDTTPDLAGADLDVDRFVRDADSSHVQVFWRNWHAKTPNGDPDSGAPPEPAPRRAELCSTGIGDLKVLLEKQKKTSTAWRWNSLDHEWQAVKPDTLVPGQIYLLPGTIGGYEPHLGWTGEPKPAVIPLTPASAEDIPDANEDDTASASAVWQTVAQHTDDVCRELDCLLSALSETLHSASDLPLHESLRHAARWHDWGKAHAAFQAKLVAAVVAAAGRNGAPIAKAPKAAWTRVRLPQRPSPDDPRRRHFRHELASALGILHPASGFPLAPGPARDLAAYLAAAHHGKVRLSIRSLPGEWIPPIDPEHSATRRFARGIWDGDTLPACDLGGGTRAAALALSLEPMELGLCEAEPFTGQPSWAERTLDLRDTLGTFLLAYLETLLRAADARASASRSQTTAEQSDA